MRYLARVARNNARIQYAMTRVRGDRARLFFPPAQFTRNLAGSQTDTGRGHCQRDRR